MDAEVILAEGSQRATNKAEPGATATATQPPKIHHFIFYGQASPDDVAAFVAAKVFLESATHAAPRETDRRAARAGLTAGPDQRRYVVRLSTKGQIATRGTNVNGEASDAEEAQSQFNITVHFPPKQSNNVPAAVGFRSWPGQSISDFTVINRSIIHCIRASSRKSPTVPGQPLETP